MAVCDLQKVLDGIPPAQKAELVVKIVDNSIRLLSPMVLRLRVLRMILHVCVGKTLQYIEGWHG